MVCESMSCHIAHCTQTTYWHLVRLLSALSIFEIGGSEQINDTCS